jgi:diguanylate cyclase (GGDEF)-like protein
MMSTVTPEPASARRQWWIGVAAAALMALAIIVALRALATDNEMHARYTEALQLSRAAIEAQHASGDLRAWTARNAPPAGETARAVPAAEMQALSTTAAALRGHIDQLAALQLPSEQQGRIAEMRAKLTQLERIGRNGVAVGETGAPVSAAALVASVGNIEEFEHSLSTLVADAGTRALAQAQRAESLRSAARIGLISFAVIALLLALLLSLLTTRALRANSELLARMSRLAQQDGLTGIANRRTLDEAVPVEFARARRAGQSLTVVMIDLDHFKRYNDRRGHAAGDALLRAAAQAWARQLRPTDLLARYGGEEFTLVLPACSADQAAQLVDRLRPLLPDRQTFSAGIATWDGDETTNELVQRADRALLQAKKAGRNRSVIAGRELQTTLPLEHAAAR